MKLRGDFSNDCRKETAISFFENNEIYAVVVLQTKSGKEKLVLFPAVIQDLKRLVELPTAGTYMLVEE